MIDNCCANALFALISGSVQQTARTKESAFFRPSGKLFVKHLIDTQSETLEIYEN
jgi:hypothetical protein